MAGTVRGGKRAAQTNKRLYGEDFYRRIGRAGGQLSKGGRFARDPKFAAAMGAIGGRTSRRSKKNLVERQPK